MARKKVREYTGKRLLKVSKGSTDAGGACCFWAPSRLGREVHNL